jgi:hypothetical protein
MPGNPALHSVFKRLDVLALEAAVQARAAKRLDAGTQPLVLDGKARRGIHGEQLPGVRLVARYAPEGGLVLAQAGGQHHRGVGCGR